MKTLCLYCPELPQRLSAAKRHFDSVGLEAQFVPGIHGEAFGVLGTHPYRDDAPGAGFVIGYAQTGLYLSHYMLWVALMISGDGEAIVLEDDAILPADWKKRLDSALAHWRNQPDAHMLLIGSSNTSDKPKTHIEGPLWDVRYPFCTHAYLVRQSALPILVNRMRDCYTNIDIALAQRAYPHLKVLTVLPRIVEQRGTDLAD